jgi:hypothetical protein
MPTTEVQELLKNPDNIEIVRDQLAGILALELLHQHELAEADPDLAAKEDYNVHVYIENDEPWAVQDDDNPFPAINVSFDSYSIDTDDGSNDRIVNGKYYIDCYAAGNYDGEGFAGRVAKIKSMKIARFVRNILQAANYRYLKLRGVVNSQHIAKCESGTVKDENGAVKVGVQRITLEAEFHENSPQVECDVLEAMGFTCNSDSGEVLLDLLENYIEE